MTRAHPPLSRPWTGGLFLLFAFASGCRGSVNPALVDLTEARSIADDLRLQFNRESGASDRAVMADTDEDSIAFAKEARLTTDLVKADVDQLEPLLAHLGYAKEVQSLKEFDDHFLEYEKLDASILELAVENTNLKAQRLSFGPSRDAADAFRDALALLTKSFASKDRCRVDGLAAKALLAVREIQVLQAPHIAESDDAAMSKMESQMANLEATARAALSELAHVDPRGSTSAAASVALERFADVSRQIVTLSRRNSNVRSFSLSLRQRPALTAACDEALRALQEALAQERSAATR